MAKVKKIFVYAFPFPHIFQHYTSAGEALRNRCDRKLGCRDGFLPCTVPYFDEITVEI